MSELNRSVFLSLKPYDPTKLYKTSTLKEDFLYLCAECLPSYSITYGLSTMGIFGRGTEEAIVIDSMTGPIGRISVSGSRIGDKEYGSNAYFTKKIREMRSIMQLKNNAYILRIYNSRIIDDKGDILEGDDSFHDFYVFLKAVNYSVKGGTPNILNVSISLVQRNRLVGSKK